MKRYPWEWDPRLVEVWDMIVHDSARMKLLPRVPPAIATRLLRNYGRQP